MRQKLQAPYNELYEILQRDKKTYKLKIRGKPVRVSINRFKSSYTLEDTTVGDGKTPTVPATTRSERPVRLIYRPPQQKFHYQAGLFIIL